MSKAALIAVYARGRGDLHPCAWSVLAALAWHLNARDDRCDPSVASLAAETGWSPRRVRSALRELQRAGLLRQTRRKQRTATYTLYLQERHVVPVKSDSRAARGVQSMRHVVPPNHKRTVDDAGTADAASSSTTKTSDSRRRQETRATTPRPDPAPAGRESATREKGGALPTVNVNPLRMLVEAQLKAQEEAEAKRQEEARQRREDQYAYQAALAQALESGIPPDSGEDTATWIARVAP